LFNYLLIVNIFCFYGGAVPPLPLTPQHIAEVAAFTHFPTSNTRQN